MYLQPATSGHARAGSHDASRLSPFPAFLASVLPHSNVDTGFGLSTPSFYPTDTLAGTTCKSPIALFQNPGSRFGELVNGTCIVSRKRELPPMAPLPTRPIRAMGGVPSRYYRFLRSSERLPKPRIVTPSGAHNPCNHCGLVQLFNARADFRGAAATALKFQDGVSTAISTIVSDMLL